MAIGVKKKLIIGVKKKTAVTPGNNPNSGALPVTITREELHRDILALFVHQARTIGWMTDADIAWKIMGKEKSNGDRLFDPDDTIEDLGVTYADIQNTSFARSIDALYDYAYFGIAYESAESMTLESIYTWTSAILDDLCTSSVMREWEGFGPNDLPSARRCRQVAELANARAILEGGEGIFYFHGPDGDIALGDGSLTVRQLALLSGMEEHSIRAAANPKRANPLETQSEDGRTRISTAVAKAWLIAKGRYLPVTRRWSEGDIDLTRRKFVTVDELHSALEAQCAYLMLDEKNKDALKHRLESLELSVSQVNESGYCPLNLPRAQFTNHEFMRKLADALALDGELVVLRAREAIATEELAFVNGALRQFKHNPIDRQT